MSITKEQFLSGVKFKHKSRSHLEFVFVSDNVAFDGTMPGYINEVRPSYLGGNQYHACVKWITESEFEAFLSICGGDNVRSVLKFTDFEIC